MYEISPSCDDDVDRTVGRLGVAVDHHRVLDHETLRGLGVEGRRGRRLLCGEAEGHQGGERDGPGILIGHVSCGGSSSVEDAES